MPIFIDNTLKIRIFRSPLQGNIPWQRRKSNMRDKKLTPDMVPVIKLARELDYNYARIGAYFGINQGRIADVMKGRRFPNIPPASQLPADFPSA
ncbi:hypothetical protein [Rhodomicrobium vannielii]|uniref:hypothetical protein n=1 Tax=Rhodomicrobium vannielii TaxID=1069 RepID=UPI001FF0725E|nr:hypothetical protein [Rhodomicrobium vannielii]